MIMDVSVIIVNYNTFALTKQCIESIYQKTDGVSFEVIVVDNNSTDGSQELLPKDNRIVFIESGENLGFGKANNLGLKHAKGKYIFFLNSDTLLVNNAIKKFFDFTESYTGKIGAIGCLLTNNEGQIIHSYSTFPSINWVFKSVIIAHIYNYLFKKNYKLYDKTNEDVSKPVFHVDYVTGADLFVERKVIEECGAFDSDFFMYYEETEMQYRWTQKGYMSFIIKTPQIIHLEGGSQDKTVRFRTDKFIRSFRSEKLYFRKTKNNFEYLWFRLSAVIYIFMLIKNRVSIRDFCKVVKALLK